MFKLKRAGGVAVALAFVTMGAQAQTALWHFEGTISGIRALNYSQSTWDPVTQLSDIAVGQAMSADLYVDLAANNFARVEVTVHGATDVQFLTPHPPSSFFNSNVPGPSIDQYVVRTQPTNGQSRAPADMAFRVQFIGSPLTVGDFTLQDVQDVLLNHAYSSLFSDSGVGVALCGKCHYGQVGFDISSVTVSPVPEPSTRAAWGLGLAAMLAGLATRGRRAGAQAVVA
jgi:hypothetical protein